MVFKNWRPGPHLPPSNCLGFKSAHHLTLRIICDKPIIYFRDFCWHAVLTVMSFYITTSGPNKCPIALKTPNEFRSNRLTPNPPRSEVNIYCKYTLGKYNMYIWSTPRNPHPNGDGLRRQYSPSTETNMSLPQRWACSSMAWWQWVYSTRTALTTATISPINPM